MTTGNKRPVETFSVVLAAQTTIPTSGTLYGSATPLSNGQIGFVAASQFGTLALNTFTDATPTVAETPVIQIAQGLSIATPAKYPLWDRPFILSNPIDGRTPITITKQVYRDPAHNVWIVGNAVGEADAVNVLDSTEYKLSIGFRGRRVMENFSKEEAAYVRAKADAYDFTTNGLSTAEAIDYILTNIAFDINLNSKAFQSAVHLRPKSPVICFLIDSTGSDGTPIGGVDPIAAGDTISVVNTDSGLKNITLTEAMATSIKDAAIAHFGDVIANVTYSILTADVSEAGSSAGGTADMLFIVALDETESYEDWIPQVKVSLEVFLTDGFSSAVGCDQYEYADEGQGLARQLELQWKKTQRQRMYSLRHETVPVIDFPSPFVANETYTVWNIIHGKSSQVDLQTINYNPFLDKICIPRYSSGTTPHAAIALVDTALNAFLASTTHNNAIITI